MGHRLDVAFDNSSLSDVCRDAQLRADLLLALTQRGARAVLPAVALWECLADEARHVEQRREALRELFAALTPQHMIIGADLLRVVALEQRKGGQLVRTPRQPDAEAQRYLDHIEPHDFAARHEALLPHIRQFMSKDESLRHDVDQRQAFPTRHPELRTADLVEVLDALDRSALGESNFFVAFAAQKQIRRAIRRAPQRYPATVMATTYLYLNAAAATFADIGYGKYSRLLRAPRDKTRGAWVDGRTAAACAHANVLLTRDRQQALMVNFIGERFDLPCRASSVSDFIAGPQAAS